MRIPTYQSEGSVSAPRMATPKVPEPIKLDKVIGELESGYDAYEKERQKAEKVFNMAEQQRVQLDLDQKYAEIKDRIDNGGSYADAEKEFQKYYDKRIKQSIPRFGSDGLAAQQASMDYQRTGVEYGMRIKSAVRSRAKSDATNAMRLRLDNIELKLSNAQSFTEAEAIMKEAAGVYAQGEGSGIVAKGSGQVGLQKLMDDAVNNLIDTDPFTFMDIYKNEPERFKGVKSIGAKALAAKKNIVNTTNRAETEKLFSEIMTDRESAERWYNGTPTAADYQNSPLGKYLQKKEKVSAVPDVEKNQRMMDLQKKATELENVYKVVKGTDISHLDTEEEYANGLKQIREFQAEVNQAAEDGVFTGRSKDKYLTLLKASDQWLKKYSAPLAEKETPGIDLFASPGAKFMESSTKRIEDIFENAPMLGLDKFEAKVKMRDAVFARQDEIKGSRKEQAAKINEIIADEFSNLMNDQYPQLKSVPYAQEADRVLTKDGSDMSAKETKKIKVDIPQDAPSFDAPEDIPAGFKGKAYVGGRPAMIR